MTHNSAITSAHLAKLAMVYIRQSSPGQVKNNRESRQWQLKMQEQVLSLGWPAGQIRVLGGDSGRSGSTQHGRDEFQSILEAVMKGSVGVVAARELSRLARDNEDWAQLIRLCRHHNVLLADGNRIYESASPQDRVLLGIQGAFSEYELAMITERMLQCRLQKAERGELYEGFPPGYICRTAPIQEKHPDESVQRSVIKVFDTFDRVSSVFALFRQLVQEEFKLPFIRPGRDWREIDWRQPSYDTLLGMLRNPIYAGVYARGRRKAIRKLDDNGHFRRAERRAANNEWQVFLEGHHEPYISIERWRLNMKKIGENVTNRSQTPRAPGRGRSLVTGILRCRRCGQRMKIRYSGSISYICRGGALQREVAPASCFSFTSATFEPHLEELIFAAVGPAAIAAMELAADRLAADRARQRQILEDQLVVAREAEARADREYKATDITYVAVRKKLGGEYEACLEASAAAQERLNQFDAAQPIPISASERQKLNVLGTQLDRVWRDSRTDQTLKKRIVRTLIHEIVVDRIDETQELQFWVHWSGKHHTEHRVPIASRPRRATIDLVSIIGTLRKILPDESTAAALNRVGIKDDAGRSWTAARVKKFRRKNSLPDFSEAEREREGWLTQAETATRLKISPMSVSRLISIQIIPSEQPQWGLPTVIRESDLALPVVKRAVADLKERDNRPLPKDSKQLSLFTSTKSSQGAS